MDYSPEIFFWNHDAFSPGKLPEAICVLLSFIVLLEYTEKDILTMQHKWNPSPNLTLIKKVI